MAVFAPAADAGWGRAFAVAKPVSLDVLAPQVQFSQAGAAAIAFSVQDADNPATSSAFTARRAAGGRLSSAHEVPAAQQVLGLAFGSGALELLTGDGSATQACCSTVNVVRMTGGRRFGRPHRLLRGLAGATAGELLSVSGRFVAVIATERGVWVDQSSPAGRFGSAHLLTSSDARPEAMSAAPLAAGGAIVAWTEHDQHSSVPRQVFVAKGGANNAPGSAQPVLSVPSSHAIDEVAVVGSASGPNGRPARGGGPTLAWIESWYDRRGAFHSQVQLADLTHPKRVKSVRVPGEIASGLSFVQNARGDQLLSWRACTTGGTCSTREVLRRAGRRFGAPRRLGSIDPGEEPTAALAPSGAGLVGWIDGGRVLAAGLRASTVRFAAARVVSETGLATDLTLGFGPTGTALAVWSEGTLAPQVLGAVYRP